MYRINVEWKTRDDKNYTVMFTNTYIYGHDRVSEQRNSVSYYLFLIFEK